MMKLMIVAGLGNPGKKYEETRHNVGFMVIDKIKERGVFPEFKADKKFNGLVSKKGDVFLLKPQTYMNRSGDAVSGLASYYNIEAKEIIIIHDDADFPLGKLKVDKERSSGGHRGVKSVIKSLSTKDFWRIRVGIRNRTDKKAGEIALKTFGKDEKELLEKVIDAAVEEAFLAIDSELEKKTITVK